MNQEVFLLQEYSMEQANVPYTNHMIYIYIYMDLLKRCSEAEIRH